MPHKIRELQLKYIINESGKRIAAILPIEEFEELVVSIRPSKNIRGYSTTGI
jgi:hypothetical protein